MTSPIKPPGGAPPPLAPNEAAQGSGPKAAEGFREALDVGAPSEVSEASNASGTEALSGVDSVVADLRAGRIDATEAVERIIAETLQGPMASMLDAAGRSELEAHLRATLEDDPNLQALVRDLER